MEGAAQLPPSPAQPSKSSPGPHPPTDQTLPCPALLPAAPCAACRSLLALANCINALGKMASPTAKAGTNYVPYRNSKVSAAARPRPGHAWAA